MSPLIHREHHRVELLLAMTEREIKARYKHAVLGFLWIILNPVLQMLVIGSVFSFIVRIPIENYFAFLFAGLLIWNFFSLTLLKVTPSIVFELSLIEKANFPKDVIVLSIVLSNVFHTVIAFIWFLLFLLATSGISISALLFLFIAILWVTILVSGIGRGTAALDVKFRDVNFFVQALVPLWFYASPIVYPMTMVPERLQLAMYFNPLVAPLELTRWSLFGGQFPSFPLMFCNLLITLGCIVWGWWLFHREAPNFDDWA